MYRVEALSILFFFLSGCTASSQATNTPTMEATPQAVTNVTTVPTDTLLPPTLTPVPSETPTAIVTLESTITPEVVFIPEGFQIGPAGLLRNPEGKDLLAFNPEVDWKQFKRDVIGSFWQANADWARLTGETNDAVNYTREEFIKAALEGQKFQLGIPVRLDGTRISENDQGHKLNKSHYVVFQMVDGISFDNIQFQVLTPDAFLEETKLEWTNNKQPAFDCASYPGTNANVCLFNADNNDNLVISVGSFNFTDKPVDTQKRLIGHFDHKLFDLYPNSFRPDGIGLMADTAASYTLKFVIDKLNRIPTGYYPFTGVDGTKIKMINIGILNDRAGDYSEPQLFKFQN